MCTAGSPGDACTGACQVSAVVDEVRSLAERVVSFVVIAYNEERGIGACLDAIAHLDGLGKHEVIVVDDGSTDGTAGLVRALARDRPTLALVSQANSGRGAARAAGVARAAGGLVAMVDGDICLPRDWLVRCRAELVSADAVGGTPVPDGDVSYLHRRFRLEPRVAPTTTTVTGSNGLYRAEVFATATFDPDLRDGEDIAFNHLLREQGWRTRCVPGLTVVHDEHKSFVASLRWLHQSGEGATRQLARYREIRQPDVAFGAFVLSLAAGAGLRRRDRRLAFAPLALLGAMATRHVAGKFSCRRDLSYLARFAAACGVDAVLLASYFAGRVTGLVRRRRAR